VQGPVLFAGMAVVQLIGIRCRQHCYHVNIMKLLWKSKTNLLVFVRRNEG
jgi:hypothetical protein